MDYIYENNDWINSIKKYEHIFIFGATNSAYITNNYIHNYSDKEIDAYIVSSKKGNVDIFNGKEVSSIDEINSKIKKGCLVIVSQSWNKYESIKQVLEESGFKHIIPTANQIKTELSLEEKNCVNRLFCIDESTVSNHITNSEISCMIYAVTSHLNLHKKGKEYDSKYIEYIQAGAALTDVRISSVCDDAGENISKENPFFCELTAGYWVAKNDKLNRYLGLYHYSRGLDISDKELYCMMKNGIDVILPCPYIARYPIITRIHKDDVKCLCNAVKEACPEYLGSVENYFSDKYFCVGNIIIATRDIYIAYYEWLMEVLRKCEKFFCQNGLKPTKRLWGYYGEHLLNIYFLHHAKNIRIVFAPVVNMLVLD